MLTHTTECGSFRDRNEVSSVHTVGLYYLVHLDVDNGRAGRCWVGKVIIEFSLAYARTQQGLMHFYKG